MADGSTYYFSRDTRTRSRCAHRAQGGVRRALVRHPGSLRKTEKCRRFRCRLSRRPASDPCASCVTGANAASPTFTAAIVARALADAASARCTPVPLARPLLSGGARPCSPCALPAASDPHRYVHYPIHSARSIGAPLSNISIALRRSTEAPRRTPSAKTAAQPTGRPRQGRPRTPSDARRGRGERRGGRAGGRRSAEWRSGRRLSSSVEVGGMRSRGRADCM